MNLFRAFDNVWIGCSQSARNYSAIKREGITAILNVAEDLDDPEYVDILQDKVGLYDGPSNTREQIMKAVIKLEEMCSKGHTVLVHCHEGKSRSVKVVAIWHSMKHLTNLEEFKGSLY